MKKSNLKEIKYLFIHYRREHNRIATELAKVNTKWNDERLYYESRRILVAFLQHITYSQFVPSVLGWGNNKFRPLNNSFFTGYNPKVVLFKV